MATSLSKGRKRRNSENTLTTFKLFSPVPDFANFNQTCLEALLIKVNQVCTNKGPFYYQKGDNESLFL